MRRPSFLMICSVRTRELRRGIHIPIPLPVVEDMLQTGCSIWRLVARFVPAARHALQEIPPQVSDVLSQVPNLVSTLRAAGAFTLVEVNDPSEGIHISIRLV